MAERRPSRAFRSIQLHLTARCRRETKGERDQEG